jgi:hypothetical protein
MSHCNSFSQHDKTGLFDQLKSFFQTHCLRQKKKMHRFSRKSLFFPGNERKPNSKSFFQTRCLRTKKKVVIYSFGVTQSAFFDSLKIHVDSHETQKSKVHFISPWSRGACPRWIPGTFFSGKEKKARALAKKKI